VTDYTRQLSELRREDAAEFGGKSANLGDLLAVEVPVPAGFALDASAYRDFVRQTGLDGTISAALAGTPDHASKTIGEAMRFAPLPDALRDELARRYVELGEPPVAVRSSALGEDSHEASYAGQQESFLWIHGFEQLCDAVRDCWASLYTPRAIVYRRQLDHAGEAMGVTVQHMVDAEVSGVLFTCNPVSGDPSMVAINASWGLGLAVVGGEVTPDDYLVSKVTREVVREHVHAKDVQYVPDAGGSGAVRVAVEPDRREMRALEQADLERLVDVARRIERYFGSHQDIEWALPRGEESRVFVVQTRPVTAVAKKPTKPNADSAMSLIMSTFGAGPPKA